MILFLDNFDSFTYNLVDYFGQLGLECDIVRNDETLENIISKEYAAVVLSPGPGTPLSSGCMMEVLAYYHQTHPVLGICLGHQAIGQFFGASLRKAFKPMHGKVDQIECKEVDLFQKIEKLQNIVRYHSLVLEEIPECLEITAKTNKGEVMAIRHKYLPISGLQFHPEAALCTNGLKMLRNWARLNQLLPC